MTRSQPPSPSGVMSSVCGASDSSSNAWPAWRNAHARVGPGFFPPELVVQIKALACELPATRGLPLSRLSTADIVREAQRSGIVARISDKTVWRWLHEDAIRPWQHRTWIFPRDPEFAVKAGRILDLYARQYDGCPLAADEFVISADEKTSIQARLRCHPSTPPRPRQPLRVEHEYERGGAWAYLAALDVHRAKLFGRCEPTTGIEPFQRLVAQVMTQSPYREARRVFYSRQRVLASRHRLRRATPNPVSQRRRRSRPHSRQLAQPSRDLLLDSSAQGADTERFSLARRRRGAALGVPALLREHRNAIRMALHQRRPRGLDAEARH